MLANKICANTKIEVFFLHKNFKLKFKDSHGLG
jgi:hypothetical protein